MVSGVHVYVLVCLIVNCTVCAFSIWIFKFVSTCLEVLHIATPVDLVLHVSPGGTSNCLNSVTCNFLTSNFMTSTLQLPYSLRASMNVTYMYHRLITCTLYIAGPFPKSYKKLSFSSFDHRRRRLNFRNSL